MGDMPIRIEVRERIGQRVDARTPEFGLVALNPSAALAFAAALDWRLPRPMRITRDNPPRIIRAVERGAIL
jgi:hypothetical protein